MRFLGLALVLAGGSLLGGLAVANTYAPRQYYGGWNKYPGRTGYYYRHYYYKPTPTYYGYKHHYVVYNRATPRYHYYYNTYTKKYWGRCPTKADGYASYEILKEEYRKPELKDIKEEHFEKYKDKKGKDAMPPVPESKDGVEMDRAPDDTPPVDTE
jgi:hypothetical protein